MAFSGAVKLASLDDFVTPEALCTKPLIDAANGRTDDDDQPVKANSGPSIRIELEVDVRDTGKRGASATNAAGAFDGHFKQMKLDKVKKTATVSLNDCLACSGCITSAETVLVQLQSTGQFKSELAKLASPSSQLLITSSSSSSSSSTTTLASPALPLLTLSSPSSPTTDSPAAAVTLPPPTSSLASASIASSPAVALPASPSSPASLPYIMIVSISPQSRAAIAQQFGLTLLQTARKLTRFFRDMGVTRVLDTSFTTDMALLEAREEFVSKYRASHGITTKPTISSECPGWICYAEKRETSALSLISSCKSPQQLLGTVVKKWIAQQLGVNPAQIIHVTVMPCFDKKLEGSRDDFFDAENKTRDVDLVLTSSEAHDLILEWQERTNTSFVNAPEADVDELTNISDDGKSVTQAYDVGASGGYADNIMRYAARALFGVELKEVDYKMKRKPDYKEIRLEQDGKVVLSFATMYGFHNIKTLMDKIKRGDCGYHYVELMACPSGCLNGGGQIRADGGIKEQKERLRQLDTLYHTTVMRDPSDNKAVMKLYEQFVKGAPGSPAAKALLHTQYHALAPPPGSATISW